MLKLPKDSKSQVVGITLLILIVAVGAYSMGKSTQGTMQLNSNTSPFVPENPQISQEASPTIDPTADWKTYTNQPYAYSVKYPPTDTFREDNTYYHYLEFKRVGAPQGEFPVFYAAAIKDTFNAKSPASVNYMSVDSINDFYNLKVGESKNIDTSTFTRVASRQIGGVPALALKVTATGINQDRYYVKHGGNIYMFVSDSPTEDFTNFLNSVKFSN